MGKARMKSAYLALIAALIIVVGCYFAAEAICGNIDRLQCPGVALCVLVGCFLLAAFMDD